MVWLYYARRENSETVRTVMEMNVERRRGRETDEEVVECDWVLSAGFLMCVWKMWEIASIGGLWQTLPIPKSWDRNEEEEEIRVVINFTAIINNKRKPIILTVKYTIKILQKKIYIYICNCFYEIFFWNKKVCVFNTITFDTTY